MHVSGDAPASSSAPRERGWSWLVLALLVAYGISSVALWPDSLALFALVIGLLVPLPIFVVLVAVAIGGCAIASWARGGRSMPALVAAILFAVWYKFEPSGRGAVDTFAFGWTMALASAFGAVHLVRGRRPFLGQALASISVAGIACVLVLSARSEQPGAAFERLRDRFSEELEGRRGRALGAWQDRVSTVSWRALAERFPAAAASAQRAAIWMVNVTLPVVLVPGLLVLESLAALALAWAAWHRLARARIGPPLARLTEFRFNDQLVWGLVLGATLVLVPSLREWRGAGSNLLLVFGVLYALRGLGVALWFLPEHWAWLPAVLILIAVPLLGPVQVLTITAIVLLALGLGDTWRDFRRAAHPLRPDLRP